MGRERIYTILTRHTLCRKFYTVEKFAMPQA